MIKLYSTVACAFAAALLASTAAAETPAQPDWCTSREEGFEGLEQVASADPWFDVYRLDAQTYAIVESKQAEGIVSYLIIGRDHALLFDTSFGIAHIDVVAKALTDLPITVLNSHSHYDHVGGNSAFGDIMGVDSPLTHEREGGVPHDQMTYHIQPKYVCEPLPAPDLRETYRIPPYKFSRTIKDGETFDLGDRQLQFLITPGHTPDSVVILDPSHGQMFTGDTYYTGPLWLFVPETDLPAYKHSLERLVPLASSFKVLRPAHGLPQADPAVLAKVLAALKEVEAGTAEFTTQPDRRTGEPRRFYKFDGFQMLMQDPPKF